VPARPRRSVADTKFELHWGTCEWFSGTPGSRQTDIGSTRSKKRCTATTSTLSRPGVADVVARRCRKTARCLPARTALAPSLLCHRADLGLRTHEVSSLALDDFDWAAGTLRIAKCKSRGSQHRAQCLWTLRLALHSRAYPAPRTWTNGLM